MIKKKNSSNFIMLYPGIPCFNANVLSLVKYSTLSELHVVTNLDKQFLQLSNSNVCLCLVKKSITLYCCSGQKHALMTCSRGEIQEHFPPLLHPN